MTDLSPAARAVMDAFLRAPCNNTFIYFGGMAYYRTIALAGIAELSVAAALRAAADQIAPVEYELIDDCWYEEKDPVRDQLLAIAAELEGVIG